MEYVFNGTSNLYTTNPGNKGFDKGRYKHGCNPSRIDDVAQRSKNICCSKSRKEEISGGMDPKDFNAFVGAPSGESLDNMTFKAGNGEYSYANQKRYYATFTGQRQPSRSVFPSIALQ
jgi:hypothetical protein